MPKTAVILFNLGGPDRKESIRPFLINFFMDKNIIAAPYFVRFLLSRYIAFKRSLNEAGSSYSVLGNQSPILENTNAQALSLQNILDNNYKLFVCMRYWHPMTAEIVNKVKKYNPDKIILLPLYPQYSTTTSFSSIKAWQNECIKQNLSCPTITKCCYPYNKGFIKASVDNICNEYYKLKDKCGTSPRLLFSAHGLPEKIIKNGDPYQWQCEESARAIAAATNIPNLDWEICYQSRVGRAKWISPSTNDAIIKAAKDRVPILIYPHAFVSEHVETLVEIEIEYRELAHKLGVPAFARVPTVSTHPEFINGLKQIIEQEENQPRICSKQHCKCGKY